MEKINLKTNNEDIKTQNEVQPDAYGLACVGIGGLCLGLGIACIPTLGILC